ncbi:hypothetical protein [Mycoplasma suis]|uniref:Uncharacterized protein n=1 Tax=Mycoplasma suis (strain Illinois) TaxID=768700 RepID=F0QQM5_MYCSL|nr:hypothetical protein [Mycoplasma suis]ADX97795.1 hypothetical protein MSU_0251 [Mycoplasma suis str. Illinois]
MSLFTLAKGVVALSTAGGAILGGYFAKSSFSDFSNETEEKSKKSLLKDESHSEHKAEVVETRREGLISSVNEEQEGNIPPTKHVSSPEDTSRNSTNLDLENVGKQNTLNPENKELHNEFPDEQESLLKGENNWDPFIEELEREKKYGFEETQEDEDLEQTSSLLVAQYVKRGSVSEEDQQEGIVCDQWGLEGDRAVKRRSGCDTSSLERKVWSRRSSSNEPLAWLSVSEDHAESILKSYGLINGKTIFKKSNGTWTTGPWACDVEKSSKVLLVSCDYYRNG